MASPIPVIDQLEIRVALAAHRITYTALAEASGLSAAYVCRIVRGQYSFAVLARRKLTEGLHHLGLGEPAATALPNLDCLNGPMHKGAKVTKRPRTKEPKGPTKSPIDNLGETQPVWGFITELQPPFRMATSGLIGFVLVVLRALGGIRMQPLLIVGIPSLYAAACNTGSSVGAFDFHSGFCLSDAEVNPGRNRAHGGHWGDQSGSEQTDGKREAKFP